MERVMENPQIMWKHPTSRRTLIQVFAVILLAPAGANTVSAKAPGQETREVKVERKPKLISSGAGQKPFDVTRHTIPLSEIQQSIPKDAIPALVHPRLVSAGEVGKLLNAKDRLLGVYLN